MEDLIGDDFVQAYQRKNDLDIQARLQTVNLDLLAEKISTPPLKDRKFLESMARLILELGDDLPTYDTVLSDEISGRLPTLILMNIIDRKRREKGIQTKVKTYFLTGGDMLNHQHLFSVENFIRGSSGKIKKALLVTDAISTGRSVMEFSNILESANVDFDIATVSILLKPEEYPPKISKRIRYGIAGTDNSSVTHRTANYVGVYKRSGYNAHPFAYKGTNIMSDQQKINVSREDVKTIAESLYSLVD